MIRAVAVAGLLAIGLTLTACNATGIQPFTYQDNKEMTGKPGLFTGSRSEIPILRD